MDGTPTTRVLICTDHRESAVRWAELLRSDQTEVWVGRAEIPPDGRPEVIVTDVAETRDTDAAVVRIAAAGPADVLLPKGFSPRELQLACRLLAEIVRLRRRHQSETELRRHFSQQALTDPLTGLPNRRAWDKALDQWLADARRTGQPLCLAILDLDHFKPVNDSHGHAVGDQVLRAAAVGLRGGLRGNDFVARLGGDEFGLLLWVPDEPCARAVVERVRTALPSQLAQAATPVLTASAGYLVLCRPDAATGPASPETVYAAADRLLRQAKDQGRDRSVGSAGQ
jgi:diguanylate cyclase (GGDEF)-like protein